MDKYVLLFRGINVGGNNRLPMKELQALLQEAGYSNVKTYIQSGNVVIESAETPQHDFAQLIETHFGFMPKVLMLKSDEFALAAENNPYPDFEGKFVHFYFCAETPNLDVEALEQVRKESEAYQLLDKVFYLHAPDGIGRSKLVDKIEKCLGVAATGRNLNTVNKLLAMLES